MKDRPLKLAGNAMFWQGLRLFGVKGIFFLRLLILASLLTPDDFGLMAIAASAVGFLMSVTNFGMVQALVQGQEVDERKYDIAWTVQLTRALLVTLVVFFSAPLVAALFSEPRATDLIRVLAFRPFIDALASIKLAGLTRELSFRPLSLLGLSQAVLNTAISIALAQSIGVWALVAGILAGSAWYAVLSYVVAPYRPRLSFERRSARPLIRFGQWIFLTSIIVLASSYILRVAISRQLGAAELGIYYLAAQIAFLPYEIATEVIASVAFPLYARLQSSVQLATQAFQRVLTSTAALLYPVCALIIVLSGTLVQDYLGPEWEGTVPVIRILTLVAMIDILGLSAASIFNGLGRPDVETAAETFQSVVIIALVWDLTARFGLIGAALSWLPGVTASLILSIIYLRRTLDKPFKGLAAPVFSILLATTLGAIGAFAIDSLGLGLLGFVLSIAIALIINSFMLWVLDKRFKLGFLLNLQMFFPQIFDYLGFAAPKKETYSP